MSAETSAWAKEQQCGDRTIKAVLREIANWANPAGHVEFLSIKRIAQVIEVDPRTVKRCIARLEQPTLECPDRLGLIRRVARFRDDGGQSASGFELVGYQAPMLATPGDKMSPPRDTRVIPRGDRMSPDPVTPMSPLKRDNNIPPSSSNDEETPTLDFSPEFEDWVPPAVATLPEKVRALVGQWPAGAYEAVCEAFRLHWTNDIRPRRKRDWQPALHRWLIGDHGKIMRDAKAGVSFAALVPGKPGKPSAHGPRPVAARDQEDGVGAALRERLKQELSAVDYARCVEPAALISRGTGEVMMIVGSEFQRDWIDANLIRQVRTIAEGLDVWVGLEVERDGKKDPN